MLDYSALTMEMFFFTLAIVVTLITAIGNGGLFKAFGQYSYLGYISIIYLYTRGIKFLYNFFYLKEIKLIFYNDRITQTSTNKTFFLNNINEKYNINMYFPAKTDNKIKPKSYPFAIFTSVIEFPITMPLFVITIFVKVLPNFIIQKSFNVNFYSLVITFPEQRAINIPYGVLHNKDIEFLENYFKAYFELQKLQKAFLYIPNKKGI